MNNQTSFLFCIAATVSLLYGTTLLAEAPRHLIRDDYASSEHPTRKAIRGDWQIVDGTASVQHDDDLYKKYANHGPIMVYEVPHTNAAAVVEFKPSGCRTVVFTMDAADGGHAFRLKLRTQKDSNPKSKGGPSSQIVTYAEKSGNEKAETIVLSEDAPKLKDDQWNRIEVKVTGDQAVVKINGESITVQHKRIAQKKKIAKLGFAFGSLSIRKFDLDAI